MITVRSAQRDDLHALCTLIEQLMDQPSQYDKAAATLQLILADPAYTLLAAEADGEVAGTVMGIRCYDLASECRPFMVVENVIVSAKYRGQGIGRRLMEELETRARLENCAYIILVSGAQRAAAHALYRSLGYNRQGETLGFRKYLVP